MSPLFNSLLSVGEMCARLAHPLRSARRLIGGRRSEVGGRRSLVRPPWSLREEHRPRDRISQVDYSEWPPPRFDRRGGLLLHVRLQPKHGVWRVDDRQPRLSKLHPNGRHHAELHRRRHSRQVRCGQGSANPRRSWPKFPGMRGRPCRADGSAECGGAQPVGACR